MKNKFILSVLLVGYLATTSCTETRDPSKGIVYSFSADFFWPEDVTAKRNSLLNIKLASDIYNNGFLDHEGVYTDDKPSFLLTSNRDTIMPREKFSIPKIDEYIPFKFYSEDLGKHNLKFTFKNSMGVEITKEQKLLVKEAKFSFWIKQSAKEVKVGEPLEIEFSIDPYEGRQDQHIYELNFESDRQEDLAYYTSDNTRGTAYEMYGKLLNLVCIAKLSDFLIGDCIDWAGKYYRDRGEELYDQRPVFEGIENGVGKFIYITRETGIRNLKISVKDKSGRIKTVPLTVKVIG